MPQVVEPRLHHGGLGSASEAVADAAGVPRLPKGIGEDAIIVRIGRAGKKPLFVLTGSVGP
jgi:hypothetical protein